MLTVPFSARCWETHNNEGTKKDKKRNKSHRPTDRPTKSFLSRYGHPDHFCVNRPTHGARATPTSDDDGRGTGSDIRWPTTVVFTGADAHHTNANAIADNNNNIGGVSILDTYAWPWYSVFLLGASRVHLCRSMLHGFGGCVDVGSVARPRGMAVVSGGLPRCLPYPGVPPGTSHAPCRFARAGHGPLWHVLVLDPLLGIRWKRCKLNSLLTNPKLLRRAFAASNRIVVTAIQLPQYGGVCASGANLQTLHPSHHHTGGGGKVRPRVPQDGIVHIQHD